MSLVVPNDGEVRLLRYLVNQISPTNLVLHLYTNSVSMIDETFTSASFTEATQDGYASVTLVGANWTVSTTSGISAAVYDSTVSFSFNENADVYGYYITDTSGNILWAEEFNDAPFSLPLTGGAIGVRPQIQLH